MGNFKGFTRKEIITSKQKSIDFKNVLDIYFYKTDILENPPKWTRCYLCACTFLRKKSNTWKKCLKCQNYRCLKCLASKCCCFEGALKADNDFRKKVSSDKLNLMKLAYITPINGSFWSYK